ncbi:MAG: hypothetical protein II666_09370 [Butyrivibrio sp.]|nr:hypothetical protein [Butyrivibrio sp.]
MNERKIIKWLILAILVLYVVSPADLLPGPVDDLIAILLYLAGNKRDLIGKKNDDANVVDVDGKDI